MKVISQLSLPPAMPAVFSAGYTPVSGAGSQLQKAKVARLLAAQLVAANVTPLSTKCDIDKDDPAMQVCSVCRVMSSITLE